MLPLISATLEVKHAGTTFKFTPPLESIDDQYYWLTLVLKDFMFLTQVCIHYNLMLDLVSKPHNLSEFFSLP